MYDELVKLFLSNLHRASWNAYGGDPEKYVESTIDFDDVYEDLKLAVESFRLILTKIINDKYNEKYDELETVNAIAKNKLDIEQKIGKK